MKRPSKVWTVPVAAGHDFELVVNGSTVVIGRAVIVQDRRGATINVEEMTPVEACQLGMVLLEASKEAATRTKR